MNKVLGCTIKRRILWNIQVAYELYREQAFIMHYNAFQFDLKNLKNKWEKKESDFIEYLTIFS